MAIFLISFVIFIVIIIILNYLIYRRNRDKYLKAGKKWDGIVDELRRRK